jgi:hypothetical protein
MDLDLRHQGTLFDFCDFADDVIPRSVFHRVLQRRNAIEIAGIGTANKARG